MAPIAESQVWPRISAGRQEEEDVGFVRVAAWMQ